MPYGLPCLAASQLSVSSSVALAACSAKASLVQSTLTACGSYSSRFFIFLPSLSIQPSEGHLKGLTTNLGPSIHFWAGDQRQCCTLL